MVIPGSRPCTRCGASSFGAWRGVVARVEHDVGDLLLGGPSRLARFSLRGIHQVVAVRDDQAPEAFDDSCAVRDGVVCPVGVRGPGLRHHSLDVLDGACRDCGQLTAGKDLIDRFRRTGGDIVDSNQGP